MLLSMAIYVLKKQAHLKLVFRALRWCFLVCHLNYIAIARQLGPISTINPRSWDSEARPWTPPGPQISCWSEWLSLQQLWVTEMWRSLGGSPIWGENPMFVDEISSSWWFDSCWSSHLCQQMPAFFETYSASLLVKEPADFCKVQPVLIFIFQDKNTTDSINSFPCC